MNAVKEHAMVTVRREIAAPPETVFDAWLDAKALETWMRPLGATRTTARVDARVGGAFEIVMHVPSGPVVHTGAYLAIDRPRRLAFTWNSPFAGDHGSRVTVDFHARGGGTEVVITHERLPGDDSARAHSDGWTDALRILAEHFAS
jgi:uncharacterized protein YndB with AHSA1/START domain